MMSTELIYFRVFFIIICLKSALCIRNGAAVRDIEERQNSNIIKFSADDAVTSPENKLENSPISRTNVVYGKFSNDYQEFTVKENIRVEPSQQYGIKIPDNYNFNSRQGEDSSHNQFNTGEYSQGTKNAYHKWPVSERQRPYSEQYTSKPYEPNQIYSKYQSYNDKPNYSQNNYAHNYNYPNKRPNHNLRATPPPRPPPLPSDSSYPSSHQNYQYQQQYGQGGRPPQRYPYPYPNPSQQQPQYDYPSYASLFNNFQAFSNPISNLFSGFGGGLPSNPVGSQLTKALETISANDDLNCIPKLLCKMAGNPERRAELPSFLTAPAITSLIAALPARSPALVFGRAALLGFAGGEQSCESMYSKCPKDEEELLFYLNNHRGGFFRFFNSGDTYSELSDNNYDDSNVDYAGQRPRPTYSGSNQNNYSPSSGSSGGLAYNILTSFASLFFPSIQSTGSGSDGLVSTVGNLLGGMLGAGRSKSKRPKRSIETDSHLNSTEILEKIVVGDEQSDHDSDIKAERIIASDDSIDASNVDLNDDEVESRILNHNSRIRAQDEFEFKFPYEETENYAQNNRYAKGFVFKDSKFKDEYVRYPPYNDDYDGNYRGGKKVNFKDDIEPEAYKFQSDQNRYQKFNEDNRPQQVRMIFPDRTGTGNLRFDNEEFDRNRDQFDRFRDYDRDRDSNQGSHYNGGNDFRRDRDRDRDRNPDYNRDYRRDRDIDYNRDSDREYDNDRDNNRDRDNRYTHRYGKILTKPSYSKHQAYYDYDEIYNKRKPYYPSKIQKNDFTNSNRYDYTTTRRPYYNRYETTTRRTYYNDDYNYGNSQGNRYTSSSSTRPSGGEGNVYVTNSNGVVDHYIKPNGQKVFV